MAWTTTKDFVGGAILTEADLDTYVSGNTDYLKTEVDSHHVLAGTSTVYAKSGGVLYESQPNATNTSSTETTLYSQSIAANTLSANGQRLRVTWVVSRASNTNSKTVNLKLGGSTIYSDNTNNATHTGGRVLVEVVRVGVSSQIVVYGFGSAAGSYSTASLDETSALTLALTGQGVDTADITLRDILVEWLPAGN